MPSTTFRIVQTKKSAKSCDVAPLAKLGRKEILITGYVCFFLIQVESEKTKDTGEASKSGLHTGEEQDDPEGPLLMTTAM